MKLKKKKPLVIKRRPASAQPYSLIQMQRTDTSNRTLWFDLANAAVSRFDTPAEATRIARSLASVKDGVLRYRVVTVAEVTEP